VYNTYLLVSQRNADAAGNMPKNWVHLAPPRPPSYLHLHPLGLPVPPSLCLVPLLVVVVQLADVTDAAPVGKKQRFRLHCRALPEDVVFHFARQRVCVAPTFAQVPFPLPRGSR
jgi:hypothetical protein